VSRAAHPAHPAHPANLANLANPAQVCDVVGMPVRVTCAWEGVGCFLESKMPGAWHVSQEFCVIGIGCMFMDNAAKASRPQDAKSGSGVDSGQS